MRNFAQDATQQIAMPMGGIGAGCVCLNGHGGLQDFAFRHLPAATGSPDNWDFQQAAFALLHIRGEAPITRLIEGPLPVEWVYDQSLQAQGYRHGGHEGLPRFAQNEFVAEYPFGHVHLSDPSLPIRATVTGWSPFIPLDDVDSGIPCAILEYALENVSDSPAAYEFSYHLSHPAVGAGGWKGARTAGIEIDGVPAGVHFTNNDPSNRETACTAALAAIGHRPTAIKEAWLRGGWFDSISALWREVSTGTFTPRENVGDIENAGRNGGSLLLTGTLAPGESVTHPILLAWHTPNSNQTYGGVDVTLPTADEAPLWRPFYAGKWDDAAAVVQYVAQHFDSLRARTRAFADALHHSTLPPFVVDAVASNLSILKSPTVLRQENGNIWGWEGCFTDKGSCHGTCTHVWNYAQAMPHLFPALERTIREQELLRSLDERGHMNFRAALPDGPTPHGHQAAADGQLGCILKLYRDWRIAGDTEWMRSLYPAARRSLEYSIQQWDPDERGGLFEPHHNTYDIEFWGADGMCGSIYVGALAALAAIADALDEPTDRDRWEGLSRKAAQLLDSDLYNGEYYLQRIQWEGLRDSSFVTYLNKGSSPGDDLYPIVRAEGPKYQYGNGCLSDGVIGDWMASLYGVRTALDRTKVRSHLQAVFHHNFRTNLSAHACTQRPGYAIGKEAGLLLCSWPQDDKPTLPFVYSDEVWTGIEYQVASHLILEGLVDEGLTIVEAVRGRYEGHVRNPFNEYECGSYYARAMASYALIGALSGFRYDAVASCLYLNPYSVERPFRTFFSTATGWGTITLDDSTLKVAVAEGELRVGSVVVGDSHLVSPRIWETLVSAGSAADFALQRTRRATKQTEAGSAEGNLRGTSQAHWRIPYGL